MIRLAVQNDCSSILDIYAPFVTDTAVTFEYKVPTANEFGERMAGIQKMYPWLVLETGGRIAGYAYASRFSEREAFDWSAELSIYINPEFHGKHLGKALFSALLEILKLQGFCSVYSGVCVPNVKSEALHESFGFEEMAVYKNIGYKLGSWRDLKEYGLKIGDYVKSPEKPRQITEVSITEEFKSIIEKAEQIITL